MNNILKLINEISEEDLALLQIRLNQYLMQHPGIDEEKAQAALPNEIYPQSVLELFGAIQAYFEAIDKAVKEAARAQLKTDKAASIKVKGADEITQAMVEEITVAPEELTRAITRFRMLISEKNLGAIYSSGKTSYMLATLDDVLYRACIANVEDSAMSHVNESLNNKLARLTHDVTHKMNDQDAVMLIMAEKTCLLYRDKWKKGLIAKKDPIQPYLQELKTQYDKSGYKVLSPLEKKYIAANELCLVLKSSSESSFKEKWQAFERELSKHESVLTAKQNVTQDTIVSKFLRALRSIYEKFGKKVPKILKTDEEKMVSSLHSAFMSAQSSKTKKISDENIEMKNPSGFKKR